MSEEMNSVTSVDVVDSSQDYIDAINTLKATTVSKDKYDKVMEENRKLLQTLVEGGTVDNGQSTEPKKSIDELRTTLFNSDNQTNLQFIENALELRSALIESGNPDPFLPYGSQIAPTTEDIECANRVADCLQQCVEYAEGDSAIFTNELQRIMIDTGPKRTR